MIGLPLEYIKQIYHNYAPEDVKSLPQRTVYFQKKKKKNENTNRNENWAREKRLLWAEYSVLTEKQGFFFSIGKENQIYTFHLLQWIFFQEKSDFRVSKSEWKFMLTVNSFVVMKLFKSYS